MDSTLYQLLILFLLFYLFLIRPEMKKAKKHQEMLNALKKGDKIMTRGGLYGVITKVENEFDLLVQIADGVVVSLNKAGVLGLAEETSAPVAPAPKATAKNKSANKKTKK